MGGDNAPHEVVKGAVEAAGQGDIDILLVGDEDAVRACISGPIPSNLRIIPSEGVISEEEHPIEALRQKPKASVMVAAGLVKAGQADAYVSMGSTGAVMACGVLALGMLDGVERPALGGPFMGLAPRTTVVDLGTNLDCRPSQLLSFGVLGAVFAKVFWGIAAPRVALLSVGAEEEKGNRQVREAHKLFRESGLNFIGNIEGIDVPLGKADVVVCDGFVGNVIMKFAEGLGMAVVNYLKTSMPAGKSDVADGLLGQLGELTNFVEHMGGGPLLGLNGVAIVGHGRSKAASVVAAIGVARTALELDLVGMMKNDLAQVQRLVQGDKE